jgi:hypothetical protein
MAMLPQLIETDGRVYPKESSGNSLRVIEVDFRNDSRWIDFLSAHPDALVYHHPGWLAALESEYRNKCVALACEGPDSSFQAILPLLPTRGLPFRMSRHQIGRRLSSLPRTPLAGPLANGPLAMKAILEHAIRLVKTDGHVQLEIKSTLPDLDRLVPALACVQWRGTYTRSLPNSEMNREGNQNEQTRKGRSCSPCDECRQLRFGSARENHQVRWAAKKAIKEGVRLRTASSPDELRDWYQLYLQVMRRNVVPPRPFRFFENLWRELNPHGYLTLVLAELGPGPDNGDSQGSSPEVLTNEIRDWTNSPDLISGSILLQFGQTAFWAFTGSNSACLRLHANDLTLWNTMHDSCKGGFNWFDLGEVAESHPELIQFKVKWGTILQPTYRYYYPSTSQQSEVHLGEGPGITTRVVNSVWQKLPLGIIAVLGDWVFRFL